MRKFRVSNLEQMKQCAKEIAQDLRIGQQIGLVGDLGTGKTTLVRFLAAELGSPDLVSSPTYVLCNLYRLDARNEIEHWDLYRLEGLPEELTNQEATGVIRLIEWADKFDVLMQRLDHLIEIRHVPEAGADVREVCWDNDKRD